MTHRAPAWKDFRGARLSAAGDLERGSVPLRCHMQALIGLEPCNTVFGLLRRRANLAACNAGEGFPRALHQRSRGP